MTMLVTTLQDCIDAGQLPDWLTGVSPRRLNGLADGVSVQKKIAHQIQAIYVGMQSIEEFAIPLLEEALQVQFDLPVNVRTAYLRFNKAGVDVQRSLLESALLNFSESEGASMEEAQIISLAEEPLPITSQAFIELCRTLDVGGRYQKYLQSYLQFQPEEERYSNPAFEVGQRASLGVAAHLALCKGDITQGHFDALMAAMSGAESSVMQASGSTVLVAGTLHAFGVELRGTIGFEVLEDGELVGMLAWIPGDVRGALKAYASWQDFFAELGGMLRLPAYELFFQRFIGAGDKLSFGKSLAEARDGLAPGMPVNLSGHIEENVNGRPFFELLATQQVVTLLGDARLLAVPTDDLELERDQRLIMRQAAGLHADSLVSPFQERLGMPALAQTAYAVETQLHPEIA